MAKVAILKANGQNATEIAQKLGITRQTVASYLQTPELKSAFEATQGQLVKLVDAAIERAFKEILNPDSKESVSLVKEIIKAIGAKVLDNRPKISQTQEVNSLTTEERVEKLKELKELIEEDKQ